MKETDLLPEAQKAIDDRKFTACRYWAICWLDGKVQCIPTTCQKKPEIIFLTVSSLDCEKGLNTKQWNLLDGRLRKHWREKRQ